MGFIVVTRLPRRPGPQHPSGELILEAPPELPQKAGRGWPALLMALPMLAGSAAMGLMYSRFSGGTLSYVTGGLFGLSAIGMLAVSFGTQAAGASKREMIQQRRAYMRHLSQQRIQVRRTIAQQRRATSYHHPDPQALTALAASSRLWERRRDDDDFGHVRIGLGPQELATPILPPVSKPLEELEPMCALALRRFITTYAVVPDMPIVMALDGFGSVHVRGDHERAQALCRAVLAQVATLHTPEDVLVAVCAAPERRAAWEWVKWLPHGLHPTKADALGQIRLVATKVSALEAMLEDVVASRPRFDPSAAPGAGDGPHLVVIVDGGDTAGSDHLMTGGGISGVTLVDLDGQPPRVLDRATLVLDIAPDGRLRSSTYGQEEPSEIGRADELGVVEAEALAQQLAPLRLSAWADAGRNPFSDTVNLHDLLQLGDPTAIDVATTWAPRPNRDRLRVPVGVDPNGVPVHLDLKESAQDGMGPHGLLIGATGSGKSELLRTLVLALAVTHSSETLNFVLIDFKGGATFDTLQRLPHTSAVITNLADELPLVDRMTDAINGELIRRQELLRHSGNYASQRDYERARAAGAPLRPLPSLLIICDEFSELLSAKPDFIEMFVQMGRVGRSLGIHLLLASQRLEEGRLRGLDSNLSYRLGLRTFTSMESRVVLGVPDAYELPRSPGNGYLRSGTEPLVRFKAAYVSGAYGPTGTPPASGGGVTRIREFTTRYEPADVTDEPSAPVETHADGEGEGTTVMDILVDRLQGRGAPAHKVWLPPLREPPTLDQILPPLTDDPARGLTVAGSAELGTLTAPVGVVDKPLEQRRDALWLDLKGTAGHVMVVGAPQSGKSTMLRTLIMSFALTHTPRQVQFYCLDFGGGSLMSLRDLPHVGGVATRRDAGQVRRTVAEMKQLLDEREQRFTELGIDSMAAYRRLTRDGAATDRAAAGRAAHGDAFGDVFLVVDGWVSVRSAFEDLEPTVNEIANRGLSFGIHVVGSAGRWMDVRPAVRDVFGTKLELRLGDPADSVLGRRAAMNVPENMPGRGITGDGLHFLSALPRADGRQDDEDLAEALSTLVGDARAAWRGPGAPPVRLLPPLVPYDSVVADGQAGLPIGIAEADLRPVSVDFAADPHFLVFGDTECGKSSFLRALAQRIVDRYSPAEARLIIVDHRRSLLGAVTSEHLIGYGSAASVTANAISEVASVMSGRLPGPDLTAAQLRARSWWKGPELYLLVDDYDLVATPSGNPLSPLLEFVAHGQDIGLHLVIARRSGGAARALYEPVIQRLREMGSPGLVMSGSRDEGKLLGTVRPSALPPGRAWLVTRRDGARLVQLAYRAPELVDADGAGRAVH